MSAVYYCYFDGSDAPVLQTVRSTPEDACYALRQLAWMPKQVTDEQIKDMGFRIGTVHLCYKEGV